MRDNHDAAPAWGGRDLASGCSLVDASSPTPSVARNYTRVLTTEALVLSTITGRATDADLIAVHDLLRADPMFRSTFAQLWDLGGVAEDALTPAGIRALTQNNPFGGGARRAFVVTKPSLYGLVRMFELLAEPSGQDVRLFASDVEARQWLGISQVDLVCTATGMTRARYPSSPT